MLDGGQVESFVAEGFVKVAGAFSGEVAAAGREILWGASGCDPGDRSSWTQPVVRVGDRGDAPFAAAVNAPALTAAFDQLVGVGRWLPRNSIGTFPIRFPVGGAPGDDGWHIDVSFPGDDPADYLTWRVNLWSQGRALLMLFLFSDVGEQDAPTRIRVGSHLRIPPLLAPFGAAGADLARFDYAQATADLPVATATGRAGDVYLCHPFLVHAAQRHRGHTPRFLAQPPLLSRGPCVLDRPDGDYSPVERAIRAGLDT
ncbi:phytanoyl-CoA dioxygenase [Nocardia vulneris]|uniref:Phytanoyl-CoA dioxygenase n=1 Tax=Nocardia vulneris TaxID=1141657 RepID=A0ABR4Z8U3_9NOCA|nr:phytanoyl-CoA dioxygenase [Nocardia vulneris]